ncbi:MAG: hypothetical protein M3065_03635 [Actinomycetota bacterium]|nr:hypothetical protein [Actinomycetota bacterium]
MPISGEAIAGKTLRRRLGAPLPVGLAGIAGVVALAVVVVLLTRMRPAYDAYGWLVWGHQALHANLNTDGAPSWKALAFLFTLPYGLVGHGAMGLWMVTAVAAALSAAVFGARIAYRLTGPSPGRRYAPLVAAAFAGVGVLGITGYSHLALIASSDPMVVALTLAAVDAHLGKRHRLVFVLLVLASLGRPEAWPVTGLYAVWAWLALPSMRWLIVAGLALIPALTFGMPALTSKSWMSAAHLDLHSPNALHGNKITGVIGRFRSLYELPMWVGALVALVIAVARRDRIPLFLAAAAALWVAAEIVFAFHGFSAVARYLIEPAAVMVVLAATAGGWVLAGTARFPRLSGAAGAVAVATLVATLVPAASQRVRTVRGEIHDAHRFAAQDDSLEAVIAREGGAARILACGQPVTDVGHQSVLAWDTGLNVGRVGYKPGKAIAQGGPIVFFHSHHDGWQVRPIHILAADRAACDRLRTDTAS